MITHKGSPVRTILFDFDGTLVFHQPDSFDVIAEFCANIGQSLDAETRRRGRRMRHEYFVDPAIRAELESFSQQEFWLHFNGYMLQVVGIEGDLDQLARDVTACFQNIELVYDCPEAGCRTLEELGARGYDLGLITNRDNVERFYELLDAMELRDYFAMTLASGEVGIRKPEPGIFYEALARMDANGGQSIYIGDNYWADVVGAERAGVTPVLFDPHHLFPEADCLVVEDLNNLLAWLP